MEVVWLEPDLGDLFAIQDHIADDNPAAAQRVARRIALAVRRLGDQPAQGRPGRVTGTRELVIPHTPYIAPYKVIRGRVVILAVLHAARRWPTSF